MPPFPSEGDDAGAEPVQTLSEILFRFGTPRLRRELENFRGKYEAEFGETDLTRRYTSTWPIDEQEWLIQNHPKRYWDGLPSFVQAFLKEKMVAAHRDGKLDDMPSSYLSLYLAGKMEIDRGGGWQR